MNLLCATCGHADHRDTGTGDFCFRSTGNGLCGCENYVEAEPYECPICGVVDCYSCAEDEKDYQDAQEGFLPAHAFGTEADKEGT